MKTLVILALATLGAAAFAEARPQKQPLQVDFNKMIDENNLDRGQLAQTHAAADEAAKKKVIDFVDMEVGLGKPSDVVNN